MSLAIFPRAWTEKPPFGVIGKASHPLHPRHAWLLNDGAPGPTNNTANVLMNVGTHGLTTIPPNAWSATWRAARRGIALVSGDGAGSSNVAWSSSDQFLNTSGGFSYVLGYERGDATDRVSTAIGNPNFAETERCSVALPYSDGVIYWDYGGFTEGTSRLSLAGATFGNDVWVFTTGAAGMQIWQNGVLKANQSGSATRVSSSQSFNFSNDLAARHAFVYLYHRQLTPTECQQITVDPYCWLQPPASKFLAGSPLAAVLTGTAIGGIGVSDLIAGGKTIIATVSGDAFITN